MKLKYIGPNAKDSEGFEIPANCYGGNKCLTGETLELEGFLAEKAMGNPHYELVKAKRAKRAENVAAPG